MLLYLNDHHLTKTAVPTQPPKKYPAVPKSGCEKAISTTFSTAKQFVTSSKGMKYSELFILEWLLEKEEKPMWSFPDEEEQILVVGPSGPQGG